MLEFTTLAPLLQAAGISEAASEPLDLQLIANELGRPMQVLDEQLERLEAAGLLLRPLDSGQPPLLLRAGRQYLASNGDVTDDVLAFLPHTIDDLVARRAMLIAGTILVGEFRAALLHGRGVEHARELVPPAFAEAVSERITLDLFAAAVALMARLSHDQPAGCVGEEILAVALIGEATASIDLWHDENELSTADAAAAAGELRGLFELFQDDDVLNLFDMREPADAAVQGHSDRAQHLRAGFRGLAPVRRVVRASLTLMSPGLSPGVDPERVAPQIHRPPDRDPQDASFKVVRRRQAGEARGCFLCREQQS